MHFQPLTCCFVGSRGVGRKTGVMMKSAVGEDPRGFRVSSRLMPVNGEVLESASPQVALDPHWWFPTLDLGSRLD